MVANTLYSGRTFISLHFRKYNKTNLACNSDEYDSVNKGHGTCVLIAGV